MFWLDIKGTRALHFNAERLFIKQLFCSLLEQKLREEPEDDDKTRSKENSKGVGGDFDYSR